MRISNFQAFIDFNIYIVEGLLAPIILTSIDELQ